METPSRPAAPFSELLPKELVGRLHADVASLVGGSALLFRADGSALTDLFSVSPYCKQILSHPSGPSLCFQSRRDLAMDAIETCKTQQALCHAGVCMVAVPLIHAGEAVAATVVSIHPAPENRDAAFLTARTLGVEPATLVSLPRPSTVPADRIPSVIRLIEDLHRLYGLHLSAAIEAQSVRLQVAQSARRMKALYNSSRAITSTLSLDQMVRVFVEQMAILAGLDRCMLAMVQNGERSLTPVGAYGLSAMEQQRLNALEKLDFGIRDDWWDRLARGRPVYLPCGWLAGRALGDILNVPADRRPLLAPVVSGGTLWAIAYLDGLRDADQLSEQEIDLLSAVAGQAGIAIANISRFQQEQRVARTLQESLLSPPPSRVGSYSIGPLYLPALAEAAVGGDFFDVVTLDSNRFAVLLGDVSGKGVSAAVHTGMMKYMARGLIVDDPSPSILMTRLNRAAASQGGLDSSFVTCFYALIDQREHKLLCTNAGHEPPLLFRAHHGEARELPPNGPAVGLMDEFAYGQEERHLGEGDALLVYTDGAVEARNSEGTFFGLETLRGHFSRYARLDGPGIVQSIHNELCKFAGGGLQDDLALLALKRIDAEAPG